MFTKQNYNNFNQSQNLWDRLNQAYMFSFVFNKYIVCDDTNCISQHTVLENLLHTFKLLISRVLLQRAYRHTFLSATPSYIILSHNY